ncbi:MAG: cyclase family protein [Candidatus Dormibacteraceae bacterium]
MEGTAGVGRLRLVDLSLPIEDHWRFQPAFVPGTRIAAGDLADTTRVTLGTHTFTHVDAPSHMIPGGAALDAVPLSSFWGEAAVIDLRDRGDSEPITADDFERRGAHVASGDIALLATGLELRHSWRTRDFWLHSPYLDRSACEWLLHRGVKATGYDFPQDEVIRRLPDPRLTLHDFPAHEILLGNGVVQVEYLANLHLLSQPRVLFFAMPLRLGAIDGGPCRAFALEEG